MSYCPYCGAPFGTPCHHVPHTEKAMPVCTTCGREAVPITAFINYKPYCTPCAKALSEKAAKDGRIITEQVSVPAKPADTIDATLAERGKTHGKFTDHALVTQRLKAVMQDTITADGKGYCQLEDDQREALEMIAHKIGRILAGNPHFHDHWTDIAGYAKLVADRLQGNAK